MNSPVLTEPRETASNASSFARLWDGFVLSAWIGSTAIVFAFVGAQLFGALHTGENADGSPVLMASTRPAPGADAGYIERVEWTGDGNKSSLRVYPTAAGRRASSRFADPNRAWAAVIRLAPEADSPGMREQFVCHWRFAEFGQPGKASWNIEPWRPQVDGFTMIVSLCNPGGNGESS